MEDWLAQLEITLREREIMLQLQAVSYPYHPPGTIAFRYPKANWQTIQRAVSSRGIRELVTLANKRIRRALSR